MSSCHILEQLFSSTPTTSAAVRQNLLLTYSFFFLTLGQEFSEKLLRLFARQVSTLAQKTPHSLATGSSQPSFLVLVFPAMCLESARWLLCCLLSLCSDFRTWFAWGHLCLGLAVAPSGLQLPESCSAHCSGSVEVRRYRGQ